MDTFKQNKISKKSPITKKQASDSGMALVLIALICFAFLRHDAWLWAAMAMLVADMIFPIIFKPFDPANTCPCNRRIRRGDKP